MAKDLTSSRIWRTVVFAGAMLGTPAVALADTPPAAGAPAKMPVAAKPDPAVEKQDKINTLDGERKALLATLLETDPKSIDKLNKDIAAKDAAIKKLVNELVALRKPRPRTPVVNKPVGRGFVLA